MKFSPKQIAGVMTAAVLLAAGQYFYFRRTGDASEVEAYLLNHRNDELDQERVEDVEPGRVWRVDLVQLEAFDSVNEAAVDFDRDGRVDQYWEFFSSSRVRRRTATADDERYDRVEERVGDSWVIMDTTTPEELSEETHEALGEAAEALAQLEPVEPSERTADEMDRVRLDGIQAQAEIWLLTQQGRVLESPVERNAGPERTWRADLFQAEGAAHITRAVLDLDLDGHYDQEWTYEGETEVSRRVSEHDDGQYGGIAHWTDDGWD